MGREEEARDEVEEDQVRKRIMIMRMKGRRGGELYEEGARNEGGAENRVDGDVDGVLADAVNNTLDTNSIGDLKDALDDVNAEERTLDNSMNFTMELTGCRKRSEEWEGEEEEEE
eukprot:761648-Hanusia_phi.AAC.3